MTGTETRAEDAFPSGAPSLRPVGRGGSRIVSSRLTRDGLDVSHAVDRDDLVPTVEGRELLDRLDNVVLLDGVDFSGTAGALAAPRDGVNKAVEADEAPREGAGGNANLHDLNAQLCDAKPW